MPKTRDDYVNNNVNDPWRYACPSCGSHTIIVRTKYGWAAQYKDVTPQMGSYDKSVDDFICDSCGTTTNVLYDKREQEAVQKHQIEQLQ